MRSLRSKTAAERHPTHSIEPILLAAAVYIYRALSNKDRGASADITSYSAVGEVRRRQRAAPKPSSSIPQSRALNAVSAPCRAASIFRSMSGSAGAARRRGRVPFGADDGRRVPRRAAGGSGRAGAGEQVRGPDGGEVHARAADGDPSSARWTTYMAMVSASAASGLRPSAWHHVEKPTRRHGRRGGCRRSGPAWRRQPRVRKALPVRWPMRRRRGCTVFPAGRSAAVALH